jgi:hypothetical protein
MRGDPLSTLSGVAERIIYDNLFSRSAQYAVAFDSIEEFVEFYLTQHGPEQTS